MWSVCMCENYFALIQYKMKYRLSLFQHFPLFPLTLSIMAAENFWIECPENQHKYLGKLTLNTRNVPHVNISLSLRWHVHELLAEPLLYTTHKPGNTSGVSESSSWSVGFNRIAVNIFYFFTVCLQTKPSWPPIMEEVYISVTYEDHINGGFSKWSEVHSTDSLICTNFLKERSMVAHQSVVVFLK